MDAIRPFVDFDFKKPERLGRKNKSLIGRHYKAIEKISENWVPLDVPKRSFKRAQEHLNREFLSIPGKIKKTRFKTVWVPKTDAYGARAVYDKKRQSWGIVRDIMEGVQTHRIYFANRDKLLDDTDKYVRDLLEPFKSAGDIRIRCLNFNPHSFYGGSLTSYMSDERQLLDYVHYLQDKYPKDFGDFMEGLEIVTGLTHDI